jgi:hypothetical protein
MKSQKRETSIANSKMQRSTTKNNELLKPVIFLNFLLRQQHLARDVRTLTATTVATQILISIFSGRMEIKISLCREKRTNPIFLRTFEKQFMKNMRLSECLFADRKFDSFDVHAEPFHSLRS